MEFSMDKFSLPSSVRLSSKLSLFYSISLEILFIADDKLLSSWMPLSFCSYNIKTSFSCEPIIKSELFVLIDKSAGRIIPRNSVSSSANWCEW